MLKSNMKSKVIEELQEKVLKGETGALSRFWEKVKNEGAPIAEEIEGNSESSLMTFIYKAEEEIENVVLINYITMFDLKKHTLKRLEGTDLWYGSYEVPNDIRFRYYFSLNDDFGTDWMKRYAAGTHDVFNESFTMFDDENGDEKPSSYYVMEKSKEHTWVKERNDILKGELDQHLFKSEGFKEDRKIRVYRPSGYNKCDKPYKYLLLTDGAEYIEILSVINVLDNLIADEKIPPIVAILIDSTEDRREELKCGEKFLDIVTKEIIPWVRDNYNISEKADESIIGGLSLGGLTAAYAGLKYSDVFGNILSQSGSFWYIPEGIDAHEKDCWMATQFEQSEVLPLKFFMNVGELESKDSMVGTNNNLKEKLISKGYEVQFEYFKSGHDYLSWGETLANGLISLIGKNK